MHDTVSHLAGITVCLKADEAELVIHILRHFYVCTHTGRSRKIVFLIIHCNPSLAYVGAVRDLQGSMRKASAKAVTPGWYFCTTNNSLVLVRERWQTFKNSWKKHHI